MRRFIPVLLLLSLALGGCMTPATVATSGPDGLLTALTKRVDAYLADPSVASVVPQEVQQAYRANVIIAENELSRADATGERASAAVLRNPVNVITAIHDQLVSNDPALRTQPQKLETYLRSSVLLKKLIAEALRGPPEQP